MKHSEIVRAWGRILTGNAPALSIEITRECPLSCPGCYAYNDEHLNNGMTLREVRDFKGQELIDGVLKIVEERKPLHLSIVGGDPMVRMFELQKLLPILTGKGIHCQIVTSAFRKIPADWKENPLVNVVVSIDGLQPEHDERRKPATYERILKNIVDAQITVHCTITRQMVGRPGYLEEFLAFWNARPEIRKIWFSLYTPQRGEISSERLRPEDRKTVVANLFELRDRFTKLEAPKGMLEAFANPPASPADCTFSRTTETISADLKTMITPCQFGGNPDCANCGCIASAGLHAVSQHKLPGGIQVRSIFNVSLKVGETMKRMRAHA